MPLPSSSSSALGTVFDQRYRVLRKLESGGMGTVYEAEQIRLGKRVAIKVLHREVTSNEIALRRFEREARLASRIRHRNVVELLDFGVEDGTAYYVMELLQGRNLAAVLREEGRLPWRRARSILLQLARALSAAHREGVIHRDVKPGNCFLLDAEDEDEGELCKVLDFGIAKLEDTFDAGGQLTRTSEILGTVAYMSPEQVQSQPVDARSDVYSLGVLAYQVLAGRLPFRDDSTINVLMMHVREPPRPPRSVAPVIPEKVEAAVLRALAKDPQDRFATMEEFKAALAAIPAAAVGSSTAIFEVPDDGSTTIPRELLLGTTPTSVLDDSATHVLGADAPPVRESTAASPEYPALPPAPHGGIGVPSGPVPGVMPVHPGEPIPAMGMSGSNPVGMPSGGSVIAPHPGNPGMAMPYPPMGQPIAAPAPVSEGSPDRILVRLAVIGAVIALLLGSGIGVWMTRKTGSEDESAPPKESTPSVAAVDKPQATALPPESVVESPSASSEGSQTAEGASSPGDTPGESGDSGTPAEPVEKVAPKPTPSTSRSGSGSGSGNRRRKDTDASVKSKLRRKAKKRCSDVGVPGTAVRVSLSIDPKGVMTLARTESPHQSSALGKCIRGAMDGARFPATGDRRVLSLSVNI